MANLKNLTNEYANALGSDNVDAMPKQVLAAIAFSLAMRLSGDDFAAARELTLGEWAALHSAGIVPQKPKELK